MKVTEYIQKNRYRAGLVARGEVEYCVQLLLVIDYFRLTQLKVTALFIYKLC
jgi:hypothetical protein